jgi:hypothetical protein
MGILYPLGTVPDIVYSILSVIGIFMKVILVYYVSCMMCYILLEVTVYRE